MDSFLVVHNQKRLTPVGSGGKCMELQRGASNTVQDTTQQVIAGILNKPPVDVSGAIFWVFKQI